MGILDNLIGFNGGDNPFAFFAGQGAAPFDSRFGAAFGDAAPPPMPMPSQTPDALNAPIPNPIPAAMATPATSPVPAAAGTPSLGESLTGTAAAPSVPLPRERPEELKAQDANAQGTGKNKFVEALKGVKMPTAPAIPPLGTPGAVTPRAPTPIKAGELMMLLQALGAGGGQAPQGLRLGQTMKG